MTLSPWAVTPFVLLLGAIAVLPLCARRWWESHIHKAIVSLLLGGVTALILLSQGDEGAHALARAAKEYAAFIALLGALFIISGGIFVTGSFSGTPLMNTALLAIGAVLASLIGTTGASMVLIRPLLRANEKRQRKAHIVIFFIFLVSNAGGLLTPLGDPPLYLGFLRGVPFLWTLDLVWVWAAVVVPLLIVFHFWDEGVLDKEETARPTSQLEDVWHHEPFQIYGQTNIVLLAAVVVAAFATGAFGPRLGWDEDRQRLVQIGVMGSLALASIVVTPSHAHQGNRFGFAPIIEVAVLFAGIFATMTPALHLLEAHGASLGLSKPWHYFWASGTLSSFLDNAPTYLTFTSAASGLLHTSGEHLHHLLDTPQGVSLLRAISCGSVLMGANTYIGNGPNFMVKSIAEEAGVKMPSFFGYMAYSSGILLPLFVAVTLIFFR